MEFKEEQVESRRVFSGRIVSLRVDTVLTQTGRKTEREVVEHPGAVAVVAEEPGGRLVLVRQYRYPVQEDLLEIPAGKMEKGEHPNVTARREMEEETGFRPGRLERTATLFTSPGFSNETLHLYFAWDLEPASQSPDEDEHLFVELLEPEEAVARIHSGSIRDAKTIAGILLWVSQK